MKKIIFGVGIVGRMAYLDYKQQGIDIPFFIDNDESKTVFYEKKVVTLKKFAEMDFQSYEVVVASGNFHQEMVRELEDIGISNFSVYEFSSLPFVRTPQGIKFYDYSELIQIFNISAYEKVAVLCHPSKAIDALKLAFEQAGIRKNLKMIIVDAIFEELDIDCLIVDVVREKALVFETLFDKRELISFDVVVFESVGFKVFENPKLKIFKNVHKNRRCFIIGNGPSLRMDDLDTLHANGEICFGFNDIFKAFEHTKWRPNYYICIDEFLLGELINQILDYSESTKFIASNYIDFANDPRAEDIFMLHVALEARDLLPFSEDISKAVCPGSTVTYVAMQVAAYMGFDEIIILGVDNDYSGQQKHFTKDYAPSTFYSGIKGFFEGTEKRIKNSYRMAEKFSRANGFRIFNATRGGKVEEFERVDFEDLFSTKSEEINR
ncbi:MAG: DUF115 domain-containing protein [Defluviitaleaceae bacterium]|nr:DUF115 domain-containing protein [Defluviitaleaceae bacterium]